MQQVLEKYILFKLLRNMSDNKSSIIKNKKSLKIRKNQYEHKMSLHIFKVFKCLLTKSCQFFKCYAWANALQQRVNNPAETRTQYCLGKRNNCGP